VISLNNIINGWKNYLWPSPECEAIAMERLAHCLGDGKDIKRCVMFSDLGYSHCRGCGCPIQKLVRAFTITNKCPIGKWGVHAINTETK